MKFPWDPQPPATTEPPSPPAALPLADTVTAMQRDMAFMVQYTAVQVHSSRDALSMLVNTPRGQLVPRGECKFSDGTTLEFQDIGMPQPGAPTVTVRDLMARVWEIARELGLELLP